MRNHKCTPIEEKIAYIAAVIITLEFMGIIMLAASILKIKLGLW